MLKNLLRKWLGLDDTDKKVEAIVKHSNIKLEKASGYTVKEGKGQLGFKSK